MGSVTVLLAPLVVPEVESLDTIEVTISIPGGGPSVTLDALPDTGANVTAIPLSQALHFKIRKTDRVLKAADGKPLKTVGTITAFVQLQGKSAIDHVYVVDGLTRALLSRRALHRAQVGEYENGAGCGCAGGQRLDMDLDGDIAAVGRHQGANPFLLDLAGDMQHRRRGRRGARGEQLGKLKAGGVAPDQPRQFDVNGTHLAGRVACARSKAK